MIYKTFKVELEQGSQDNIGTPAVEGMSPPLVSVQDFPGVGQSPMAVPECMLLLTVLVYQHPALVQLLHLRRLGYWSNGSISQVPRPSLLT